MGQLFLSWVFRTCSEPNGFCLAAHSDWLLFLFFHSVSGLGKLCAAFSNISLDVSFHCNYIVFNSVLAVLSCVISYQGLLSASTCPQRTEHLIVVLDIRAFLAAEPGSAFHLKLWRLETFRAQRRTSYPISKESQSKGERNQRKKIRKEKAQVREGIDGDGMRTGKYKKNLRKNVKALWKTRNRPPVKQLQRVTRILCCAAPAPARVMQQHMFRYLLVWGVSVRSNFPVFPIQEVSNVTL